MVADQPAQAPPLRRARGAGRYAPDPTRASSEVRHAHRRTLLARGGLAASVPALARPAPRRWYGWPRLAPGDPRQPTTPTSR